MAGIYIHIPFCKQRCIYCDFYSNTQMQHQHRYITALCRELELRRHELVGEEITSIYWGGGTPSQLDAALFQPVFDAIQANYKLASDMEITLEANPDDLSEDYLKSLQPLLFNRISMGVQSFFDDELKFLNRRHTAQVALDAVARCRQYGYENLSIDLIYGLPQQSLSRWQENVAQAIALRVPHISAYSLTFEEGTALERLRQKGEIAECDEELSLAMFRHLTTSLKAAGFEHYEISNFAHSQAYARHNTSYWQEKPYLGVGAAAHSYTQQVRSSNVPNIVAYMDGVEQGCLNREVEELSPDEHYNDLIVISLRTMWGLDLSQVAKRYGEDRRQYALSMAAPHIARGNLLHKEGRLVLSPEGVFISDGIISDLLYLADEDV